ncbi:alpha/beta fold hydrolase [Halorhabdus salina]|uniref:alpha/beta fold hydrolase n=1 Tax=Halorhabdus salina TaxID=2750670 RepID=UPI0015EE70C7|nr:alpha/beta hydrolase [Halorhabdus salina]
MQTVTSADGTPIAYERHGDGPPIICLHGSSADRHSFGPLAEHLAGEYTLVVPDRRGRGDSGDGPSYSLAREVEDLQAILTQIEGTPTVFGHSFGGLLALAAMPDIEVRELVLYEPAVLVGDHRDDNLADRLEDRLGAGEHREALRLFIEEAGGVPDATALPWWPEEAPVDRVDTVVRESRAVEEYRLPAKPAIDVPTVLLTGEYGPEHLRDALFTLEDRLSAGRVRAFDGVGHMGIESAAERVGNAVDTFLK